MSGATQESSARSICLIQFRDCDRIWHRVDETGFNKVGYVTRRHTVIHPRLNRGLTETPIPRIRRYPHAYFCRPGCTQAEVESVERFFTENTPSIELFNSGLWAILSRDDLSYFDNPIKTPMLDSITREEFERRWTEFRSIIIEGDIIMAIHTTNLISRLIARFDHGTWSHVGLYSGDGTILEAIPAGVVERDIEVYHDHAYRLGAYRAIGLPIESRDATVSWMRSKPGARYNIRGVMRLAVLKSLGIQPRNGGTGNVSPNDIARSGRARLIYVV